jgi:outer membrane receptor protein involved in Fe transport
VLRGPQGTLYGASSMGGLLKYVTVAPSTAGVSGRVQVNIEQIDGAGLGYGAGAAGIRRRHLHGRQGRRGQDGRTMRYQFARNRPAPAWSLAPSVRMRA